MPSSCGGNVHAFAASGIRDGNGLFAGGQVFDLGQSGVLMIETVPSSWLVT